MECVCTLLVRAVRTCEYSLKVTVLIHHITQISKPIRMKRAVRDDSISGIAIQSHAVFLYRTLV